MPSRRFRKRGGACADNPADCTMAERATGFFKDAGNTVAIGVEDVGKATGLVNPAGQEQKKEPGLFDGITNMFKPKPAVTEPAVTEPAPETITSFMGGKRRKTKRRRAKRRTRR